MATPLNRRMLLQIGLGSAIWGHSWAQESGRTYRLGCLVSALHDTPHHVALRNELRRSGFIEGTNFTIDRRGYGLQADQFAEHAAELVRAGVDVILAGGDVARPGGNITGVTILASELDGNDKKSCMSRIAASQRTAIIPPASRP